MNRKRAGLVALAAVSVAAVALAWHLSRRVPRPNAAAEPATYLAHVRQLLSAKWPHNRTVNIVCHGHSVPCGYTKPPIVAQHDAYPQQMLAGLKAAYPHAVVNVIVTAKGGE